MCGREGRHGLYQAESGAEPRRRDRFLTWPSGGPTCRCADPSRFSTALAGCTQRIRVGLRGLQLLSKSDPALQSSVPGAKRVNPPLTEEKEPLAVLNRPPLTEERSPLELGGDFGWSSADSRTDGISVVELRPAA